MNSTLPTPRDMPPHRQAQIRAELQRAIAGERQRRRVRYAPMITALAALAVLAVVALLVPWQQDNTATPASDGTPTPTTSPKATVSAPREPEIPGLPSGERAAIETGCAHSASQTSKARLYNLVTDAGGKFGLLYSDTAALECTIGGAAMPYNSGFGGVRDQQWLPGDMSVDTLSAAAGGSVPGGKSEYRGELGTQIAAGRISDKVAKVTYTEGTKTVEAVLANGTFVARILRPATWKIPERTGAPGPVRAYDANGRLLAAANDPAAPINACYVTPDGGVVAQATRDMPDPKTCLPATPWR